MAGCRVLGAGGRVQGAGGRRQGETNLRLSWIFNNDNQLLFSQLLFQQLIDVKAERVVAASVAPSLDSIDEDLEHVEEHCTHGRSQRVNE